MTMEHPDHDRVHRITDDYRDMCHGEKTSIVTEKEQLQARVRELEQWREDDADTIVKLAHDCTDKEEALQAEKYTYAKCTICGTSHVLGLMCPNINKHSEVL